MLLQAWCSFLFASVVIVVSELSPKQQNAELEIQAVATNHEISFSHIKAVLMASS